MGGAQPLAVTMNGGVVICRRRRPGAAAAARRAALSRRVDRRPRRRRLTAALAAKRERARAVGRAGRQRATRVSRTAARAARDRHRHRPDLARTTRSTYLPEGIDSPTGTTTPRPSRRSSPIAPAPRWRRRSRRWSAFMDAGAEVFDYGNSIRGEAQLGRLRARLRLSRFRAGLHPAAVLRGQGTVPLGRAVGRSGGHRGHRSGGARAVPRERGAARAGFDQAQERVAFQGLPARICWLGYGERDRAGSAVQRAGRHAARSARRS